MINIQSLNDNSKIIGSIIIFIVFIIGIIIIIDEVINVSKFCYKYTYLYYYGNANEKICKSEIIEYETSRYRIYNELNKYKLHKDLFNKNWVNYLVYLSVFILTILVCVSFGYLFYHFFIDGNYSCSPDNENLSFIKSILKCFCDDCHKIIPNCSLNYMMLIAIILIYPFFNIFKFVFNVDLNNRIFIIVFYVLLFYYIYVLFNETKDYETKERIFIIVIYITFISIFFISQQIFKEISSNYNNLTLASNLYKDNENNDETFFDIYSQEEPQKPAEVPIPTDEENPKKKLLPNFTYCNQSDFNDPSNNYCYGKDKEVTYNKNKEKIDKYYNDLNEYKNDMKKYTNKYNIYKNNKIEFPSVIYIITTMLYKLLGLDNNNIRLLFILLLIILVIYFVLKFYENKYANYFYYTAFVYVISILVLLILSNAIFTYNTYLNKFLIYEPISNYKYNMNNMNMLFNIHLNEDYKKLKDFYFNNKQKVSQNDPNLKPTIQELLSLPNNGEVYSKVTSLTRIDANTNTNEIKIPKDLYYYKYSLPSQKDDYITFSSVFDIRTKANTKIDINKPLELTLEFNKYAEIYKNQNRLDNKTIKISKKDLSIYVDGKNYKFSFNSDIYKYHKKSIILPISIKDQYNREYDYVIINTDFKEKTGFTPEKTEIIFDKSIIKYYKENTLKDFNTKYTISDRNIDDDYKIIKKGNFNDDLSLTPKPPASSTQSSKTILIQILNLVLLANINDGIPSINKIDNTIANYKEEGVKSFKLFNIDEIIKEGKYNIIIFNGATNIKNIYNIDINKLRNQLKYHVYKDTTTTTDITEFKIRELEEDYDLNKKSELITLYKNNIFVIDKIFEVYMEFIEKLKLIISKILNSINTDTCDTINKNNIDIKINSYISYFNSNDNTDEQKNAKITFLKEELTSLNNIFNKHFNIITYIIKTELDSIKTIDNERDDIVKTIINNYNIYNIDNKHIDPDLILKKDIPLNLNEYNKYMDMKTTQIQELNKSTNSVAWSYVILNIIFAMVLLEPQLL